MFLCYLQTWLHAFTLTATGESIKLKCFGNRIKLQRKGSGWTAGKDLQRKTDTTIFSFLNWY